MKKPNFLKRNNTIGVCAPSDGFIEKKEIEMCKNSETKLKNMGYKVKYGDNCFKSINGRSAEAKTRANEFLKMINDDTINVLIAVGGGEYEMEILQYINFETIETNKLFCGFSDNSTLCFLLTTICNIQTIYGHNFYEIGIDHKVIENYISFLEGKFHEQTEINNVSLKDYSWTIEEAYTDYKIDYFNKIKYYNCDKFDITGMMIGGLLENLSAICGTKYDKVKSFINKYKDDGFIWYIDICLMSSEDINRALWQLKNANWFDYAKAIIIGRPILQNDCNGKTYQENIFEQLKSLNIPTIIDANFGHIPPSYCACNGKKARITNKDKFIINYI